MPKRVKIFTIILIAIFGGLILFNIIRSILIKHFFANYTPPAVTVSSVTAKAIDWNYTLPAVGNFSAVSGVNVNSQIGGNVVAIHFKSGDVVAKDQPLIDLDDTVEHSKNLTINVN